ncbi:hypothetical protein QLR68_32325, partial [Micromonospora sp. DH15]|nr:hypothetical protein [Micromonospora sp. DH15]
MNLLAPTGGRVAPAGRSLLRLGPLRVPVRRRPVLVAAALVGLLVAAGLLSLSLGTPYVAT